MMKHEFEALAGYEVSIEDYTNIIEPMYMSTDLSKQDFVKCIDKKRFALKTQKQIINSIKKEARHLAETCEHYTDYESRQRIEDATRELENRFGGYWYTISEYAYPEIKRGCTYPARLIHYVGTIEHGSVAADVALV